ncbi:MAG: hypothetical protein QM730_02545 [Anaerolineales bacterium]
MKRILSLILLLVFLGVLGVFTIYNKPVEKTLSTPSKNEISEETRELLSKIRNDDVVWRGGTLGLMPELSGASLMLSTTQENINPFLLEVIVDENKFVAAHVLLTMRTPETFTVSGSEWNGLRVHLRSNGKSTYESNDLIELQKYWIGKLKP